MAFLPLITPAATRPISQYTKTIKPEPEGFAKFMSVVENGVSLPLPSIMEARSDGMSPDGSGQLHYFNLDLYRCLPSESPAALYP